MQVSRAISSAFDSIAKGISNAREAEGTAALQKAASSFETLRASDSFSSMAPEEIQQTGKISDPGQMKSPEVFFREVSQSGEKSELAEKILRPNFNTQIALQDLGKTFDHEIKKWEEQLNSIGDDAQLANVDMQNWLQKVQQALQMISNISKMSYDTDMSIIRKIGG